MADDISLHVREREVEAARAKLAADLDMLTAPHTFSEFTNNLKADVVDFKDHAIAKAKSSAESTVQGLVEEVKARAAANPAAVLAIGAGIAWRLIRHPPVATVLIGAGLYSLFRTTPSAGSNSNESLLSQATDSLREQVTDLASATKDQALALGETIADKASELTSSVSESASALSRAAADKITETATAATGRAKNWSETAQTSLRELAQGAKASVTHASQTPHSSNGRQSWSPSLQPASPSGDTLLLGIAGAAVAAAMGFALQRRMSDAEENR